MAVFKYDPDKLTTWVNNIMDDIGGEDANSLKKISDAFKAQMNILLGKDVWTGSAAVQNFTNFQTVHDGLVSFANDFMSKFESSMTELNTQVGNLETTNLGTGVKDLGALTKTDLTVMDAKEIPTEYVTYDYAQIVSIGGELDTIKSNIATFESNITGHLNEIACGGDTWEGNAAESTKGELKSCVTKNLSDINTALQTCISNIKKAGENAQAADSGAASE